MNELRFGKETASRPPSGEWGRFFGFDTRIRAINVSY
jgi:hypothetical protein